MHTLDSPWRRIVVQDELESVFHVLIYYAVRFVDSNIDQVDNFICDYFDARLQYSTGDRCGLLKKNSIKAGVIDVSSYNDARLGELEFYLLATPSVRSPSTSAPAASDVAPDVAPSPSTPQRRASSPCAPSNQVSVIILVLPPYFFSYCLLA